MSSLYDTTWLNFPHRFHRFFRFTSQSSRMGHEILLDDMCNPFLIGSISSRSTYLVAKSTRRSSSCVRTFSRIYVGNLAFFRNPSNYSHGRWKLCRNRMDFCRFYNPRANSRIILIAWINLYMATLEKNQISIRLAKITKIVL